MTYYYGDNLRFDLWFDNPNHAGILLVCLLPFIWWGLVRAAKIVSKAWRWSLLIFLWGLNLGTLYFLAGTYSRGAFLALVMAAGYWVWTLRREFRIQNSPSSAKAMEDKESRMNGGTSSRLTQDLSPQITTEQFDSHKKAQETQVKKEFRSQNPESRMTNDGGAVKNGTENLPLPTANSAVTADSATTSHPAPSTSHSTAPAVVISFVLFGIFLLLNGGGFRVAEGLGGNDDSVGNRFIVWQGGLEMIAENPSGGRRLNFQYEAGVLKTVEQVAGGDRVVLLEAKRDAKGRVSALTIGGVTNEFHYTDAGRLAGWKRHGLEWESYSYTDKGVLEKTQGAIGLGQEFVSEYRPPNFHRLPDSEKMRIQNLTAIEAEQEAIRHYQLIKDGSYTYEKSSPWQTQVTKATDLQNRVWSADVSVKRGILKMTDPEGKVTTTKFYRRAGLAYDWQPREVTDRNGRRLSYNVYDDAGNLTGTRDALGHWTLYTYNGKRQVTSVSRRVKGAETDELLVTYGYDQHGRVTVITDAQGGTRKFSYNQWGDVVSFTDSEGRMMRMNVNDRGQVTSVTGADGNTANYRYDGQGRLAVQENADGVMSHYVYDGQGRFVEMQKSVRNVSKSVIKVQGRSYDQWGRLLAVEDGIGRTSAYEYDEASRLAATVDPRGVRTVMKYDEARRLAGWYLEQVQQESSSQNSESRMINNGGAVKNETDNSQLTTASSASSSPRYSEVTFGFDVMNRLVSQKDGLGNVMNFNYDEKGRFKESQASLGSATTDSPTSHQELSTSHSAATAVNTYDDLGRLVRSDYGAGQVVEYEYELLGRVSGIKTPAWKAAYQYDNQGRVTSLTLTGADGIASYDYGYTPSGQRAWMDLTVNGVKTRTAYEYDSLGRLAKVSQQKESRIQNEWRDFTKFVRGFCGRIGERARLACTRGRLARWLCFHRDSGILQLRSIRAALGQIARGRHTGRERV